MYIVIKLLNITPCTNIFALLFLFCVIFFFYAKKVKLAL